MMGKEDTCGKERKERVKQRTSPAAVNANATITGTDQGGNSLEPVTGNPSLQKKTKENR
jgi:hypothetical protein